MQSHLRIRNAIFCIPPQMHRPLYIFLSRLTALNWVKQANKYKNTTQQSKKCPPLLKPDPADFIKQPNKFLKAKMPPNQLLIESFLYFQEFNLEF